MASSLLLFDEPKSLATLLLEHQTKQAQLNKVLAFELAELWPLLVKGEKALTYTEWLLRTAPLINQYALAAAALGGAAYLAYRYLAVPNGYTFTAPSPSMPSFEQIARSLGWATRNVGPDAAPETLPAALTQTQGAAQRLVTNTGRQALVQAVDGDPEAKGWRRIPSDQHACAFCRLMSIRGPVYKSEQTAGRTANRQFVGAGEFKFHDHCECTAVPVFRGQHPRDTVPSHVERWIEDWDHEYRVETGGYDGVDKLNAFRRAVEND